MISLIIPCLNEATCLPRLLKYIEQILKGDFHDVEVVVVVGGSTDNTVQVANQFSFVQVIQSKPGRASQMNVGAKKCSGEVLYFVHADTLPPENCFNAISNAVAKGAIVGGFSMKFDSKKWILKFNNWATSLNLWMTRGGDQSIFMTRRHFIELNGYNEEMVILEEYDLLERSKKLGSSYQLLKGATLVNARKYEQQSWLSLQVAYCKALAMWKLGYNSKEIRKAYTNALKSKTRYECQTK